MVQAVVQQAVAQEWRPLPQTMRKAAAFQDSVNALVFDVLMDKVRFPTDQVVTIILINISINIDINIYINNNSNNRKNNNDDDTDNDNN